MDQPGFVLCYIRRGNELLMIHRNKTPNKGLWNCVGGHIEAGEIAETACVREVFEETGFKISQPVFHGILTWEGFEIPSGGLYMFSIDA
ncbi:MAG: NUDIX domain-containing protein, partial [Anaerolineaceae bacterium]|nr:NUDIX domain-containing protein [Anaerolineaceae bacterium]